MEIDVFVPPPGHPLAGYVESIFRLDAPGGFTAQTVMPRGTASFLFNLGGRVMRSGSEIVAPGAAVLGGLPTAAYTLHPAGPVSVLGVALRGDACSALLRPDLAELTDANVEGAAVVPGMPEMLERMHGAAGFAEQRGIVLEWLARLVRPRAGGPLVRHACRILERSPEPRVGRIARGLGISERHLRRVFLEHVGVTPAHYRRLTRFRDAVGLMASPRTLGQVAHAAGYADQAHFCRDFGDIGGMTPGEYRQRVGPVPGLIFSP